MTDELGIKKTNRVCHEKRTFEVCAQETYCFGRKSNGQAGYSAYSTAGRLCCCLYDGPYVQSMYNNVRLDTGDRYVDVWFPPADEKLIVQQLYNKAIRPVADHLLNLWEADDLPRGVKSFSVYADKLGSRWEGFRSSLRTCVTKAARLHLAAQFGILPLVRDISASIAYMKRLKHDVSRLQREAPKTISTIVGGYFQWNLPADSNDPSWGTRSFQGRETLLPTRRYVLTFKPKVVAKSDFFANLDNLCSRFGSGGPAEFAWERIPFSFVVDWFLDTSSLWQSIDELLQAYPITTINLSRSEKYSWALDFLRDVRRSDTYTSVQSYRAGIASYQKYARIGLTRDPLHVVLRDRIGKKEMVIATSLLLHLSSKT